jgi:6-phosphofructokinase 1
MPMSEAENTCTHEDRFSLENLDTSIQSLGECSHVSPLVKRDWTCVSEGDRNLASADPDDLKRALEMGKEVPSFERAGPRETLFFDPAEVTCAIVTCGGLCPGLNDVIRSIVLSATYSYGVKRILGFRYGYAGLAPDCPDEPLELTPERVSNIHDMGGTILGSSRGPQDPKDMVKTLQRYGVNILFTIGGDGTLSGAESLAETCQKQGLPISVIGVPKTIDNDIFWISRSFGFTTAVLYAKVAITAAHVEATGASNGIGLVRLMGRNSGFIAAHATLSNPDVNFCLIPEAPFSLRGKRGLFRCLEERLRLKRHAVIVVAEGAGQHLFADEQLGRDASGNAKHQDIGVYLKERISDHLKQSGMEFSIKYIDPSYIIRSLPATALDSEFCLSLGQSAVHAGMAGCTSMMIGFWNMQLTHVPFSAITGRQRKIDPRSMQWQQVLEATGQPREMK